MPDTRLVAGVVCKAQTVWVRAIPALDAGGSPPPRHSRSVRRGPRDGPMARDGALPSPWVSQTRREGSLSNNAPPSSRFRGIGRWLFIRLVGVELDRFASILHRLVDRFALTDTTGERGHMHCVPTLVAWLQYDLQLKCAPPLTHFSIVGPTWRRAVLAIDGMARREGSRS